MGRCPIKVAGKYLEWSTVVDAPVTYGMTEDELRDYYAREHGEDAARRLPETLERVRLRGTSSYVSGSLEETVAGNRAGEHEVPILARPLDRAQLAARADIEAARPGARPAAKLRAGWHNAPSRRD